MYLNVETLLPALAALGIGLLIGLERERSQQKDVPAGVRTFALTAKKRLGLEG